MRACATGPLSLLSSLLHHRSQPSTAAALTRALSLSATPALQQAKGGGGGGGGKGGGGGGAKGGSPGGKGGAAAAAPAAKAPPSAAAAAPPVRFMAPPPTPTYLPNHGAPTRPEVLRIQLRLKAFHKFYLNRYVFLLALRFKDLGLPRPSQAFLPTRRELYTVLRSPHVDKRARDQFERNTHKRVLTFTLPQDSQGVELSYRLLSSVASLTPGVTVRVIYHATGLQGASLSSSVSSTLAQQQRAAEATPEQRRAASLQRAADRAAAAALIPCPYEASEGGCHDFEGRKCQYKHVKAPAAAAAVAAAPAAQPAAPAEAALA